MFTPGTLITGKQLRGAGFSKFYKVMHSDDIHNNMYYKEGENTDILPFDPTGRCEPGGLYFATVDEIFSFVDYGNFIREVTVSDNEPIYIDEGKMKAHTIYLGERTPLWTVKTFSKLIHEGADIHADDDYALRWAAKVDRLKVVKLLVSIGANIHAYSEYALRWAAANGHLEVVQFLISVEANIHAYEDYAIRFAASNGHLEIVKLLVSAGANIHVFNSEALQRATGRNHMEVAKYLISVGADTSVLTEAQKAELGI